MISSHSPRQNPGKLTYGTAGTQSYYYLIGQALEAAGRRHAACPLQGQRARAVRPARPRDRRCTDHARLGRSTTSRAAKCVFSRLWSRSDLPALPKFRQSPKACRQFRAPLSWFGFFGPAGMPQPVVAKLNAEIANALRSAEIGEKIKNLDLNIFPTDMSAIRPLIAEFDPDVRSADHVNAHQGRGCGIEAVEKMPEGEFIRNTSSVTSLRSQPAPAALPRAADPTLRYAT